MTRKKVAVAMSGGVDSSLAAALLKKAGYEVSGVHMQLWEDNNQDEVISDLEHTCHLINIPLHKLSFGAEFQRLVVNYFCQEYSLGFTPNPCITCNQYIKFGLLLEQALQMGADYLATGHYARIEKSSYGYNLLKAADRGKDQSYFLYTLGQRELKYLLLPLGNHHKAEVRRLAAKMGLPTSSRRESQDVCFIPDNDYQSFIATHIPLKTGDIIDIEGKVLGKHNGLARYTVGQRHGLGLASSKRMYVIKLNAASNQLVLGTRDQLLNNTLLASNLSWVSGKLPEKPINVTAKIRYRSPEAAAVVHINNGVANVNFQQPQRAIAPGQAIVFYQDDIVLGGGVIEDRDTIFS